MYLKVVKKIERTCLINNVVYIIYEYMHNIFFYDKRHNIKFYFYIFYKNTSVGTYKLIISLFLTIISPRLKMHDVIKLNSLIITYFSKYDVFLFFQLFIISLSNYVTIRHGTILLDIDPIFFPTFTHLTPLFL